MQLPKSRASRVKVIKKNGVSYITYRILYNFHVKRNIFTGKRSNYAEMIFRGKKRLCKLMSSGNWIAKV